MNFWFETPSDFVTIEYGRYEAVKGHGYDRPVTWTPVLAGPATLSQSLAWRKTSY